MRRADGGGFAADEAVKTVVQSGISRVLVRASGDIAAADPPPGARGWRIGIAPLNPDEPPTRYVEIANCGISTSGGWYTEAGIGLSRILDLFRFDLTYRFNEPKRFYFTASFGQLL